MPIYHLKEVKKNMPAKKWYLGCNSDLIFVF